MYCCGGDKMDVLESVQYGDLTTEQKDTVDLIGMDAFLFLVEKCGGTNLYIPKKETVGRTARKRLPGNMVCQKCKSERF